MEARHLGRWVHLGVVAKNITNAPLCFYAAPLYANSVPVSLGLKFSCSCTNTAVEPPPRGSGFGVAEMRMDDGLWVELFPTKQAMIGLNKAWKNQFELPQ